MNILPLFCRITGEQFEYVNFSDCLSGDTKQRSRKSPEPTFAASVFSIVR